MAANSSGGIGSVRTPRWAKIVLRCPLGYGRLRSEPYSGRKRSRNQKQIDQLLILPPGELLVEAGLVVGEGDIVERRRVERVAIALDQRSVVFEILRDIGVAVHVAAIDLVLLAFAGDRVAANGAHAGGFVGVDGNRFGEGLGEQLERRHA